MTEKSLRWAESARTRDDSTTGDHGQRHLIAVPGLDQAGNVSKQRVRLRHGAASVRRPAAAAHCGAGSGQDGAEVLSLKARGCLRAACKMSLHTTMWIFDPQVPL